MVHEGLSNTGENTFGQALLVEDKGHLKRTKDSFIPIAKNQKGSKKQQKSFIVSLTACALRDLSGIAPTS